MKDEELHDQNKRGAPFEGLCANQPEAVLREANEAAIYHNRVSVDIQTECKNRVDQFRWHSEPSPQEALPWPERGVYFMRQILAYSRAKRLCCSA